MRLKKIYVVHAAAFINQVMAILKPLIKSELLGLLSFTSTGGAGVCCTAPRACAASIAFALLRRFDARSAIVDLTLAASKAVPTACASIILLTCSFCACCCRRGFSSSNDGTLSGRESSSMMTW